MPYSSTFGAPEVHSTVLVNQSVAFARLENHAIDIRKMLNTSESKKAFLVTGVMTAMNVSLDPSEPISSWSEINMAASKGRSSPEVGVSSGAEENTSFGEGSEVIFALKYQAIWFTRFSKRLRHEPVINDNSLSMFGIDRP